MKTEEKQLYTETERLYIKTLENEDYERWIEGFRHRLPSQHKFDGDSVNLEEWSQERFDGMVEQFGRMAEEDDLYVLGIFRKSDDKHIGKIDLSTIMRDNFQWGMIGYRIHNQFWNQGYGAEAVSEGLTFAFDELGYHRVEAHINLDNPASIKLAEKVGMTFECTRKGFIYEDDKWTDNHVYVVIRE
ncbi:GNAT family protein [Salimicrobium sp. PL1-032A]|uniref:GNAT family N-acetyltransferase n=1 Tax=Salimicrobium sp. PL1-032A TaxID=3095364 RepID=UPI003260815E